MQYVRKREGFRAQDWRAYALALPPNQASLNCERRALWPHGASPPHNESILKVGEQLADNLGRKILRHVKERGDCLCAPIIALLSVEQLEDARD